MLIMWGGDGGGELGHSLEMCQSPVRLTTLSNLPHAPSIPFPTPPSPPTHTQAQHPCPHKDSSQRGSALQNLPWVAHVPSVPSVQQIEYRQHTFTHSFFLYKHTCSEYSLWNTPPLKTPDRHTHTHPAQAYFLQTHTHWIHSPYPLSILSILSALYKCYLSLALCGRHATLDFWTITCQSTCFIMCFYQISFSTSQVELKILCKVGYYCTVNVNFSMQMELPFTFCPLHPCF